MKGFESMPNQEPQAKPKIMSMKPVESEELESLGAEIEEEMAAEAWEKLSAEEKVKSFYTSPIWAKWEEVKASGNPEVKEPVRQEVLNQVAALVDKIKNNEKLSKALESIKTEVEKDAGHA